MTRLTATSAAVALGALVLAGPARAVAPDPERSVDRPVQTQANSPYVGTNAKAMFKRIGQIGARVSAVDVLVVKGKPRYALGFVANRGHQSRGWWWDPVVSQKTLLARLKSRNARLIDLSVFEIGGKRRLSAVSVANTGEAQKTWWWHARVKRSAILALAEANGSRVVDLERGKGGLYDVLAIKNDGIDQRAWWLLFNIGHNDVITEARKRDARLQDIEHVGSNYDFDAVLVQQERPRGWFFEPGDSTAEMQRRTRSFGARTAIVDYYVGPLGRTVAHVGVTDVDAATEAARAQLVGDSERFKVDGTIGMLTSGLGPVAPLVSLNADLPHETASAMKALHHAAVTHLYEQKGLPIDKPGDFAYRQYIGLPSCPLKNSAGRPIVKRTLAQAAVDMLQPSDNGATAAMLTRVGGKKALTAYARSLGMQGVRLGKPLGCFDREAPNLWTLNDAARLYASIVSGRVATKEPERKPSGRQLPGRQRRVALDMAPRGPGGGASGPHRPL